jgi:hypothetical protein
MCNQLSATMSAVLVLILSGAGPLHGQAAPRPERTQPQDQHLESQRQRQLSQTLVEQGIHAAAKLNGGE